eukprot:551243-Pleurochrysis_carterae.AAC.3
MRSTTSLASSSTRTATTIPWASPATRRGRTCAESTAALAPPRLVVTSSSPPRRPCAHALKQYALSQKNSSSTVNKSILLCMRVCESNVWLTAIVAKVVCSRKCYQDV